MNPRSTPWGTYRQIADTIRRRIADGALPAGAPVPSEAELGAEYGVARSTIRRALAVLESDGLVRTVPGTGRVVRRPAEADAAPVPQYRRIAAQLREQIARGDLPPGALLPSEAELARTYGVARATARHALSELEGAGLIVSQHGRGRYVRA